MKTEYKGSVHKTTSGISAVILEVNNHPNFDIVSSKDDCKSEQEANIWISSEIERLKRVRN
jgi:hypothetical protein